MLKIYGNWPKVSYHLKFKTEGLTRMNETENPKLSLNRTKSLIALVWVVMATFVVDGLMNEVTETRETDSIFLSPHNLGANAFKFMKIGSFICEEVL